MARGQTGGGDNGGSRFRGKEWRLMGDWRKGERRCRAEEGEGEGDFEWGRRGWMQA